MNTPMHPDTASKYVPHGDQEISALAISYLRLLGAVQNIYFSAVWSPDRPVNEQEKLWEELRVAAGFHEDHVLLATEAHAAQQELVK